MGPRERSLGAGLKGVLVATRSNSLVVSEQLHGEDIAQRAIRVKEDQEREDSVPAQKGPPRSLL